MLTAAAFALDSLRGLLAQLSPQYLARYVLRQGIGEDDLTRTFKDCKLLAAIVNDLLLGRRLPLLEDDECHHRFALIGVGVLHNCRIRHRRMLEERLLDLTWIDVEA